MLRQVCGAFRVSGCSVGRVGSHWSRRRAPSQSARCFLAGCVARQYAQCHFLVLATRFNTPTSGARSSTQMCVCVGGGLDVPSNWWSHVHHANCFQTSNMIIADTPRLVRCTLSILSWSNWLQQASQGASLGAALPHTLLSNMGRVQQHNAH